ncbi:MAG TPA: Hsp20/alpha crystallin family protein [Candidatus Acidoferrales bacterium]|nr:Hsp20/alpha crystallin family protein [Candidatus Acidoferrales bacterium]
MSAQSTQKENKGSATQSGTQSSSSSGERTQQGLARRSAIPDVPSLLLDPLGFFDNGLSIFRRLFDMNRGFGQTELSRSGQRSGTLSSWVPAVEVDYRDGNLIVSAELPGMSEDDVDVQVVNDTLIIQGERRDEREENEGGARRTEIRYGQFYRAIPLPGGAQTEQAHANFENGILRVTIPVPQTQSNSRQIPIQASGSKQQSGSQKTSAGQPSGSEKAA